MLIMSSIFEIAEYLPSICQVFARYTLFHKEKVYKRNEAQVKHSFVVKKTFIRLLVNYVKNLPRTCRVFAENLPGICRIEKS